MRPDWDTYFLGVAESIALRGDCRRRKVGAVLVTPDHLLRGAGYNGGIAGTPSCLDGACPRGLISYEELPAGVDYSACIATHAEENCIRHSSPAHVPGSTVYVTTTPCSRCIVVMTAAKVRRVVWPEGERLL